ncbi:nonstructural protein [Microviridae sp.]|nr:nonstructural protein [Microviridae sp.]
MLLLFSIYDNKAELYSPPFTAKTLGEAIRMFTDTANDQQTQLCRHPTDFALYQTGDFDPDTGQVQAQPYKHIGMAADFKTQVEAFPYVDNPALDLKEVDQ